MEWYAAPLWIFMAVAVSAALQTLAAARRRRHAVPEANCKICGASDFRRYAHTARCRTCGVLLYYPYPPPAEPREANRERRQWWYERCSFLSHQNMTRTLRFFFCQEDAARPFRVLDYGGGGGQMALIVKSHLPRAEIDLVDLCDGSALSAWTPMLRQIKYRDFPSQDVLYDVIFLTDVFEHLDDPIGTLRLLSGKLTPAGRIVLGTPRQFWAYPVLRRLSRRLYRKLLQGTVSRAHLQIWSDRAFAIATQRSGLQIVQKKSESEFTMQADFYLGNMGIGSRSLLFAGRLFYRMAHHLAHNKIYAVLSR